MMMNKELLTLLKDARLNQKSTYRQLDYQKLYQLADQHQVSALIYNQIYDFPDFPNDLKQQWRSEAIKINAFQTRKTFRLLDIYQKLRNKGIDVIVVKGIICRSLYPQGENRQSNDEDLYIKQKDLQTVKDILLEDHFQIAHESEDVTTFIDFSSGLSIEMHTQLFSKDSKAYGKYQSLFDNAFEHTTIHSIQGVDFISLDHDYHLLFLILHFVKHFLHSGAGIRQVLDIVVYSETYQDDIDWKKIFEILKYFQVDELILNLFSMAHDYFDFNINQLKIDHLDYQDLLDDIMNAGIFGQTSKERIHSSTITLNAFDKGKTNVFKSLFPTLKEMQAKYEYLNKYPYLLPFAYISRIIQYQKTNKLNDGKQTIEIGQQRVNLLKKYKVMK